MCKSKTLNSQILLVETLHIVIVEGFNSGSHKRWVLDIQSYSQHRITILSLPGRHWKWRMHGAAITLAKQFLVIPDHVDAIMCTDMMDVSLFKSIAAAKCKDTPLLVYFHENQLTYPWSSTDQDPALKRDNHYGFINYTSALVADQIYFNSHYHLQSFNDALLPFLSQFPDYQNKETTQEILAKSSVLPLGFDFTNQDNNVPAQTKQGKTILWNHRWEYDKNPELFFNILFRLKDEGVPFQLIVAGESTTKQLPIFDLAKERLHKEIVHFGYCENRQRYHELLASAHILPVTSKQDFFGMSVVEAIGAGVFPLLPNRLAYPEHIPAQYKSLMLYEDIDELNDKLKSLLLIGLPDIDYTWIRKYDWSTVAGLYDSIFTQAQAIKYKP